ncbi:MAG: hypothetical protein JXA51_07210 [Dehalococcoidales bacterium]|nr:hypothetical protein [Dehalococcoidales bacterium]
MGRYSGGIIKVLTFVIIAMAALATLPQINTVVFPSLQEPSDTYDCDDGTLEMYRHFKSHGIESTPIIGNLDMDGEAYMESNHVWLLVKAGEKDIAYDWGIPRFDRQHYEGYPITIDYLMYAVEEDNKGSDLLAAAE